jgi:DNA-binding MarR family transcriptional regulator
MPIILRGADMVDEKMLTQHAIEIQVYSGLLLKHFNQALEKRMSEYGDKISGLQHGILRMLQAETLTASEISQRLGLDPSTVVRAVDSLERKKLARRGSDPNDRRRNPLSITDQGSELVNAVPVISVEDEPLQALHSVGAASVKQLRDLLYEIIAKLPEGQRVIAVMANAQG